MTDSFSFAPSNPPHSTPRHAHNTLSKDHPTVSVSALKSANNPHNPAHKYLYRWIKNPHFIFLSVWVLWFNVQWRCEKKSLVKFSVSVSRKEAKPCFIPRLLSHQVKWHDEFYHTESPFRAFLNECQFSLTQLLDGKPHWRMIVTPLTFQDLIHLSGNSIQGKVFVLFLRWH